MRQKNYEMEELYGESEVRSKKYNVLSYLACVLAAIVIWLVIMNVTEKKVQGSVDGGTTQSVASIELTV